MEESVSSYGDGVTAAGAATNPQASRRFHAIPMLHGGRTALLIASGNTGRGSWEACGRSRGWSGLDRGAYAGRTLSPRMEPCMSPASLRPGLRTLSLLALPVVLSTLACQPGSTDRNGADDMEAAPSATDAQDVVDQILLQAATAREKIQGLAEAIPEEHYDWRPAEGVRSVGEVFQHVAADNYLLPAILGVDAPAETGITMEYATVQAYEARDIDKAQIVRELDASFDHLEAAVAATREDLDRTASAFGTEFTTGGLWTMAVTHLHEHLGQGIAYARSNGVVPPWSR